MEKFDLKELSDLWLQGKDINAAIESFIDCELIKKQVLKKHKKPISNTQETGILGQRQKQQKESLTFSKYEKAILNNLYEKIISKQLLAIGYQEPVGGSDQADLIPQEFWPPENISLELSSVMFEEANFINVRIVENPKTKVDFSRYDLDVIPVGRPTSRELLVEAYEYLLNNNHINYQKSFDSQVDKIHKAVQHLNSEITDNKNMADKTIKKHLSPRFQLEAKAFKLKNL